MRTPTLLSARLLALGLLTGCSASVISTGSPVPTASDVLVDVAPASVEVRPGGTVVFAATVTGTTDGTVTWEVEEGAAGGTVSTAGIYTAPTTDGTFHVMATSAAHPGKKGKSKVTVTPTPSVTVSVIPSTATVAAGGTFAFTASVTGSSDTAVTWSVSEASGCGAVNAVGAYTAATSATTCHVVAQSVADPTKSGTAIITVGYPVPSEPNARFVSHGGNDVTGTGTVANPWQTLSFAVSQLKAGDTLYIRGSASGDGAGAVWVESLRWRSGSGPVGTASARVTIKAYPGETVRLQPDSGTTVLRLIGDSLDDEQNPRYVTFEDLIIDGRNLAGGFAVKLEVGDGGSDTVADAYKRVHGPHHIRFSNCEIRNSPGQGIMVAAGDYNEFLNLNVHDNGMSTTSMDHGLYLSTSHNLIEGGSYHDNAVMGIQIWNEYLGNEASYNTIRNVDFYDNGHNKYRNVTSSSPRGIGVFTGRANIVENCRVWTTAAYAGVKYMGIDVDYGARDVVVRNCTVHDASTNEGGIHVGNGASSSVFADLSQKVGAWGTQLLNNVLYGNGGGNQLSGQIYVNPAVAATTTMNGNSVGP
jgi:hypothetical protein